MKFRKLGIVLVVVIAVVGVYFFAPNLLSGVPSDQAKLKISFVNVPAYVPSDSLKVECYLDEVHVGSVGDTFIVPLGSSHSYRVVATNPDGTVYAIYNGMFNAPSKTGTYSLVLDATSGSLQVVDL